MWRLIDRVDWLEDAHYHAEQSAINVSRMHAEQVSRMQGEIGNLRRTVHQFQVGSGGVKLR